mmetsp:Transcript_6309/g.9281  ORF Transcript_6309/g.9281 Transcript_6309/m.9281 type:complete len:165 (+) Transcript_6309:65-559(+)
METHDSSESLCADGDHDENSQNSNDENSPSVDEPPTMVTEKAVAVTETVGTDEVEDQEVTEENKIGRVGHAIEEGDIQAKDESSASSCRLSVNSEDYPSLSDNPTVAAGEAVAATTEFAENDDESENQVTTEGKKRLGPTDHGRKKRLGPTDHGRKKRLGQTRQ